MYLIYFTEYPGSRAIFVYPCISRVTRISEYLINKSSTVKWKTVNFEEPINYFPSYVKFQRDNNTLRSRIDRVPNDANEARFDTDSADLW